MSKDVQGLLMRLGATEAQVVAERREKKALHEYVEKVEADAGRIQYLLCAFVVKSGGRLTVSREDLAGVPNGVRLSAEHREDGSADISMVKVDEEGHVVAESETKQ